MAHGILKISLKTAKIEQENVHFLIIGNGARKEHLMEQCKNFHNK